MFISWGSAAADFDFRFTTVFTIRLEIRRYPVKRIGRFSLDNTLTCVAASNRNVEDIF